MILKRLTITDFRGFSQVDIEMDGKSTVFFGVNGVGKTSVLRSINLLYANIINKVVNRKELRQQYNIELEDIQHGKQYAKIQGDFVLYAGTDETVTYERGMERKTGKRTHNKDNLSKIAASIQAAYMSDERQEKVPVFVNYGTNRLVLDIPLRIRTHHEFDVYSAYEKAYRKQNRFSYFF